MKTDRMPAGNSSLAKWRVTCFYDSFVLNQSAVLRLSFCAKIPPLRQAAKRYRQPCETDSATIDESFIRR